ncbi:DUF222 domain-containing protein [Microbacterium sp. H1-D42]|uniref:HNH endonuclease n=1 Tax=Microbacterium sp. H1-D42 TaxID=2925844 RepID=UPI001F53558D|nr:DUF222 domain-containing protein [Microbacterium sp. H1-D42]UNK71154.1 DUF222 domain-containing protein [Microbacterium sp. H1-D42]
MHQHLSALHEALSALDATWADAGTAADLSRPSLVATSAALGSMRRQLDALQVEVAAEIAHESRPELGADSLAKQNGFRNPAQMIAATTGSSTGDAARLVELGKTVAPRTDLVGDPLPPKYPAVQSALRSGALGAPTASLIVTMLDRVRLGADADRLATLATAERQLVDRAKGLSLDDARRLVTRAEATLAPEHLEADEQERRAQRSLTMFERNGMLHLNLVADIESGAEVRAAVDGNVTAQFSVREESVGSDGPDADHRTVAMMRADALARICAHALGCDDDRVPMNGATVVVRVNLADLRNGTGFGTIDGTDQPISIGAVRRMAASSGVIPCVLGSDSEILDWGRRRRLFTPAQKLALVDRDGGCAMCGLPPGMTKVHHIDWWKRDAGPTDLENGILLCETCHHRIHDNGWQIRIEGTGTRARVWFIPPPYIDSTRTPRLGGRARYDIAA